MAAKKTAAEIKAEQEAKRLAEEQSGEESVKEESVKEDEKTPEESESSTDEADRIAEEQREQDEKNAVDAAAALEEERLAEAAQNAASRAKYEQEHAEEAQRNAAAAAARAEDASSQSKSDPATMANDTTPGGEAARSGATLNAAGTQGAGDRPLTQLEAMQLSAIASRQARTDATVTPQSTTLQSPDAELRSLLTNDALTASREAMAYQAAEGEVPDAQALVNLHDAVTRAQKDLDEAMFVRDQARDAYDRALDLQSTREQANGENSSITGYLQRQKTLRRERARLTAAGESV